MKQMVIIAAIAMAACSQQPTETTTDDAKAHGYIAAPAAVEDAPVYSNSFAASSDTILTGIEASAARWTNPFSDTTRADSFSQGQHITRSFKDGSIDVYTNAEGKVWRVAIRSGMGDRCNKRDDGGELAALVIQKVAAENLRDDQISEIGKVWLSDTGLAEVDGVNFVLKAAGGCVDAISVSAKAA